MLVIIPRLNAPMVSLNIVKGPFVTKKEPFGMQTFYLCNEYVAYDSFVMLGNIPKSN